MSKETSNAMLAGAQTPAAGKSSLKSPFLVQNGMSLYAEEIAQCHAGAPWWRHVLLLGVLIAIAAFLLQVIGDAQIWVRHRAEVLLTITGIAFWRWGWFLIQNVRAIIYRYFTFPRLRREAQRALLEHGPVPEVTVLATTYHEKRWITGPVFESVFSELRTVQGLTRRPKVVVVTGCDQDDKNIREIFARCCGEEIPESSTRSDASAANESAPQLWPPELVLLRGDKGKRPALGSGMEEIAKGNPRPDGVVIVLDGDTMLQPGLLEKVLPVFRLSPPVEGVTTNENGFVKGPAWFAEWTSLRFGLRHRSMCSVSWSGKLLCLTGRFSVFRASVVTNPTFREQVEHDVIRHWLWGSFEMLSGDDKSTWYWLSKEGKRMLYVPDAMVTTFEVVAGSSLKRAIANVRRWSGNSVRHSWRAIMLGPKKLGWFPWWCLVDQRLTTFTVLFGPIVATLALWNGRYEMLAGYLLWVMCSRMSHAAIAFRQGRRLSAYYVPLQVISDWATALTKLWVLFHPAKQNWLNRGARTFNSTKGSAFYSLRSGFAHYLYGFSCAGLLAVIGLFVGFFPLPREARLFLSPGPEKRAPQQLLQPGKEQPGAEPASPASLASAPQLRNNFTHTESPPPSKTVLPATWIPDPWMAVQSSSRDAQKQSQTPLEPTIHDRSKF